MRLLSGRVSGVRPGSPAQGQDTIRVWRRPGPGLFELRSIPASRHSARRMEPRELTADRGPAPAAAPPRHGAARLTLACACAFHVVHDGFSDALSILLPLSAHA